MSKYGKSVNNLFYTYSCLFVKNNNSMREFVSQKIFHCKPNLAKSRNLYGTSCVDNPPCPYLRKCTTLRFSTITCLLSLHCGVMWLTLPITICLFFGQSCRMICACVHKHNNKRQVTCGMMCVIF